jgi:hypothetical protein
VYWRNELPTTEVKNEESCGLVPDSRMSPPLIEIRLSELLSAIILIPVSAV